MAYYICRLCALKCTTPGLMIFSPEGISRDIPRKIHECLHFLIMQENKYPKILCPECLYKLDMVYEFRRTSLQAQSFICELFKHDVLDYDLVVNGDVQQTIHTQELQSYEQHHQPRDLHCLCLNDEMPDHSTIEDLQHLVGEAELNTESGDISRIIEFQDDIVRYQMEPFEEAIQTVENVEVVQNFDRVGRGEHSEYIECRRGEYYDDNGQAEYIARREHEEYVRRVEHNQYNERVENIYHQRNEVLPNPGGSAPNENIQHIENGFQAEGDDDSLPDVTLYFQHIDNAVDAERDDDSLPDVTVYTLDSMSSTAVAENLNTMTAMPDCEPKDLSIQKYEIVNANEDNTTATEEETKETSAKTENEIQILICEECGKGFSSNYKLKEHHRSHSNDSPFHCGVDGCIKRFRSKIGLLQHKAKHMGEFEFACDICGKGFAIKSYLATHMKTHNTERPYECSLCNLSFKAKQGLVDHENRHLGLKAFQCDICEKRFITKSLCDAHLETHSSAEPKQEHPCNVCSKKFASKSSLKLHMKIHLDKQFMCEFCGKTFLGRTDLKLHETTHTNARKFVCETCGKAFNRANCLKSHRRIHAGLRPYQCSYCQRTFSQGTALKIHTRTHTGENPYVCSHENCSKRFISRTSMLKHMRKHPESSKKTPDMPIDNSDNAV